MKRCINCNGDHLTWFANHQVRSGVPDGRIRLNEVETFLILGCDDCSETLLIKPLDNAMDLINKALKENGNKIGI